MAYKHKKEFDIVIYGASGYIGRYVIEELCRSPEIHSLKWAIAGRNHERLMKSLQMVQEYLIDDVNIQNTPIIYADSEDSSSLHNMCEKTKLILNCVGPYNLYNGELVVATCIKCETHYIDISAELKYLVTIQAKYFNLASEKKVYIIEACGFGSLPADYGISLLKQEFPGELDSVEYFVKIGEGPKGRSTNIGTMLSGMHSVKHHLRPAEFDEQIKTIFKLPLPHNNHPLKIRYGLFHSEITDSWCFYYPGPDKSVLKRSQMFRFEYLNEKPIQSQGYYQLPTFGKTLLLGFCGVVWILVSLFSIGRRLLIKYPSFFTGGFFSKTGPTREQVLEGTTQFTLIGTGWEEGHDKTSKPNSKIKLTISGPEAAYPFTAMCMVQAGLTVLLEEDKLPLEGGVLTPGVAFERTTLHERLQKRGMQFDIQKRF